MKFPGSTASIGIGGGSRAGLAFNASWHALRHAFNAALAFSARIRCACSASRNCGEFSSSMRSSARRMTRRPGVLRSPLCPTMQVQSVVGSIHDDDA